ncbi:MAG: glycoside hydrolase family 97 catalytic domain-containing protein [Verrucomicrobiota bacterium JB022]|nr:glycoside hydrolase family 97 catalytic domain-containing protein [Verrucomicrobiota bacterium JB022]
MLPKTTLNLLKTWGWALLGAFGLPFASAAMILNSPDGNLALDFYLDDAGQPHYSLERNGRTILEDSPLGLASAQADLTHGFLLMSLPEPRHVTDEYTLNHGKQREIRYEAEEQIVRLEHENGMRLEVIFRLSNDGLAFRYRLHGESEERWRIEQEHTGFVFPEDTQAWIQPMAKAQTGWSNTQPSYEENYQIGVALDTLQPFQEQQAERAKEHGNLVESYPYQGWVFPALFLANGHWVLLSEAAVDGHYCASHLAQDEAGREFRIGFPDAAEAVKGGPVKPTAKLPWLTPWRLVVVANDLSGIVESNLGTDLAEPARFPTRNWMRPGHASWSWVMLKDDATVYDVQRRFIDYAAEMHWDYCLVDASWDEKIGYEKLEELARYATSKGVGVLAWYNSAGDWNTTPYTPKSRLLTHEKRREEFARLQEMGIKGVKIDFFPGDGQSVMQYYRDILQDAAEYELLVNFHGCTLPRGWHRTFPNLMTMESVKGMEFITFVQSNADAAPAHMAMLPFTRNVFDPMDFTPMAFSKIPNIERRTRKDFELATAVLYYSGIQHFAETDVDMAKQPEYIRNLLRELPRRWDETRFVDGQPGEYAVLARRAGNKWYLAGVNAREEATPLDYSRLPWLRNLKTAEVYTADEDGNFVEPMDALPKSIPARGGVIAIVKAPKE